MSALLKLFDSPVQITQTLFEVENLDETPIEDLLIHSNLSFPLVMY